MEFLSVLLPGKLPRWFVPWHVFNPRFILIAEESQIKNASVF